MKLIFLLILTGSIFHFQWNILFSETSQPKVQSTIQPKDLNKQVQETIKKVEEEKSSYMYISSGKRDPFMSPSEEIREKSEYVLEGLKGLGITALKLKGILSTQSENVAMVKSPDGKLYILKNNSKIGSNARVKEVYRDKIIIEVKNKIEEKDSSGKIKIKTVLNEIILSLQKR